jgi:hypothetical protein
MASLDRFLHYLPAGRPQWALAASGQKPEPLIFGVAVKKNDAFVGNGVMKSGRWILGEQSKKRNPPGLVGIMKDLFAQLPEFFYADGSDGFSDGFAPLLVEVFEIEFFEWHRTYLFDRFAGVSRRKCDLAATLSSGPLDAFDTPSRKGISTFCEMFRLEKP